MRLGRFGAITGALLILVAIDTADAAGNAESVRFICDNPVTGGVPNRFEIDFSRKTVLEFDGDGSANDPITPEDTRAHAVISKNWIRWTDTFDGQKYSIQRSNGELKKVLLDGTLLYSKTCKKLASGAAWQ